MKIIQRIIKLLSSLEDIFVFFLFLVFFLIGTYGMYDSYKVYQSANDKSILQYKPGYEGEQPEDKKIVGNMVAWITLDDTTIDYPIMQGKTNNEYLNIDPFGNYSMSGSIFLDSRNSSDFSDSYSLVYGHHMEGEYMFGALDNYLTPDYFKNHKTGSLIVGDKAYTFKIFATLEADASERIIFAPTEVDKKEVLSFINKKAIYKDEEVFNQAKDLNIMALSTCQSPDTTERTIVVGTLSPKNLSENNNVIKKGEKQ